MPPPASTPWPTGSNPPSISRRASPPSPLSVRGVRGGCSPPAGGGGQRPGPGPRLGVARDRAFCFYYAENLRLLAEAGVELVEFSPLADAALPPGLSGLYLGGGYPELSAATLAANAGMRRSVRDFCRSGRPVLAECGGFMYLMDGLTDLAGREYAMCGVYPLGAVMGGRFAALGYREVVTRARTLLGPAGTRLRGHEFHYSRLAGPTDAVATAYSMTGRKGPIDAPEGFMAGGTLGSYVHLHFGGTPGAAAHFAAACEAAR